MSLIFFQPGGKSGSVWNDWSLHISAGNRERKRKKKNQCYEGMSSFFMGFLRDASNAHQVLLMYCSCENEHQKNSLNYWVSQYGDKACMASISLQREGNLTKELFQYGGFLMPSDKLVLLIMFSFNNKTTNKTVKQLEDLHWLYLQHPRDCLLKTMWIKEQTDHFTYDHDCHKHTGLNWFYSGVGKKQNSPTVLTQGW